jgi:hypothetical protein
MIFAHTGHVLVDLSVFLGPVLMVVIWVTVARWVDRRKGRDRS